MRDCKQGQLARSCQVCELEAERGRLKAELEIAQAELCVSDELIKDRDLWKSKAEKMAEALRQISEASNGLQRSTLPVLQACVSIAKAALTEFEKEKI